MDSRGHDVNRGGDALDVDTGERRTCPAIGGAVSYERCAEASPSPREEEEDQLACEFLSVAGWSRHSFIVAVTSATQVSVGMTQHQASREVDP